MATQTIQFCFLTGQAVTVKLFADDGSDTVLATPTATEATNRTGVYTFTQTDRAAGNYLITVSATGINAEYSLPLTLTTATFWAVERANVTHISGDSAAADNLESAADGTGYNLGGGSIVSASVTGAVGSVTGAVGSVVSGVTVTTNNDKTGYSLTQSFPTNFASLAITGGGAVTAGTVSDKTGYSLTTSFPSAAEIADQVWDDTDVHSTAGSAGAKLIAIQAKTDTLPTDPADASDIAASFSTVNTKLDTIDDFLDTEIAAMKVVTDKYGTMVVQDGLVYQFTTNALENGPAGGGGGGSTVAVYPLNATMPARVYDLNLTFYKNEDGTVVGPISVSSRNANVFEPVDLSGRTLSVRFVDYEGTELLTVANGDITVSGADDNQISFPVTSDLTGSVTETPQDQWHIWTLHDLTSGDNVLIGGKARVLLC